MDAVTLVLSVGFGYFLGLLTGIYYIKEKMMSNIGSDELNPADMIDQVEDMLGDFSDGDPEIESPHEDRKPGDANTSEKLDDILGDDKDE